MFDQPVFVIVHDQIRQDHWSSASYRISTKRRRKKKKRKKKEEKKKKKKKTTESGNREGLQILCFIFVESVLDRCLAAMCGCSKFEPRSSASVLHLALKSVFVSLSLACGVKRGSYVMGRAGLSSVYR